MSTELIGQRLAQLRKELAGPEGQKWTQVQLAEATGLSINMISRIENLGGGSIEMLQVLLTFYYQRGFNPSWVMIVDNSAISKLSPTNGAKTIEVTRAVAEVREFAGNIVLEIDRIQKELLAS